ncbi:uncharacterized protein DSM5745_11063 [Aspergillus mulundensis]|uniref:Uncharacterized protein n=1 Tax=Aspergillus mulundensis TaxID=1810919 RepID=A0A3D8QCN9_9EURO|nr:hypothetical protein DSM5745_11063 [Aspergillus mulundensis]RDW59368.1 hypothetical protein DSM5745_11063 [Aspergillus mulundensis]
MSRASGLGDFGRLPYDVRCLIWTEVAEETNPSTDLAFLASDPCFLRASILRASILRASKDMYEEINGFLFFGGTLQIEMGPHADTLLRFLRYHARQVDSSPSLLGEGGVETSLYMDSCSLDLFPWHILDGVEVILESPYTMGVEGIYYMWRNIEIAVKLLRKACVIRRLTVSFHEEDLVHPGNPGLRDFDYGFFLRPFGQLRQTIPLIEIMSSSNAFVSQLDWRSIDCILGTNYEPGTDNEPIGQQELRCRLAEDWYNVCLMASTPGAQWGVSLSTLEPIHQAILAGWLREMPGGKNEFEERFDWLWTNCRDFLHKVNPTFSLILKTYRALKHRTWAADPMDDRFALKKTMTELDGLADSLGAAYITCFNGSQGVAQQPYH